MLVAMGVRVAASCCVEGRKRIAGGHDMRQYAGTDTECKCSAKLQSVAADRSCLTVLSCLSSTEALGWWCVCVSYVNILIFLHYTRWRPEIDCAGH